MTTDINAFPRKDWLGSKSALPAKGSKRSRKAQKAARRKGRARRNYSAAAVEQRLLAAMAKVEVLTAKQAAATLDLPRSSIVKGMRGLIEKGKICRLAGWRYCLAEKQEEIQAAMEATMATPKPRGRPWVTGGLDQVDQVRAALAMRPMVHTHEIMEQTGLSYGAVQKALARLRATGEITRVISGYHALAGTDQDALNTAFRDYMTRHHAPLFQALDDGMTTVNALSTVLGVSRQRVDQILSKLMEFGAVERHLDPMTGLYAYSRPGVAPVSILGHAPHSDPDDRAVMLGIRLLNLLPDRGWVQIPEIVKAMPLDRQGVDKLVEDLVRRDLIIRTPPRAIDAHAAIAITRAGRVDPERLAVLPDGKKRLSATGLFVPMSRWSVPVIKVISALGPQPTIALRVLCDLPAERAGVIVQHLREADILTPVPSILSDQMTLYGLAAYGQVLVDDLDFVPPTKLEMAEWHEKVAQALRHWDSAVTGHDQVRLQA